MVRSFRKALKVPECLPSLRFNYLGDFDSSVDRRFFTYVSIDSGRDVSENNHLSALLDIDAYVLDRCLRVSFTFYEEMFPGDGGASLLNAYIKKITELVEYCLKKDDIEFTPSDFETVDLPQAEIDSLFV